MLGAVVLSVALHGKDKQKHPVKQSCMVSNQHNINGGAVFPRLIQKTALLSSFLIAKNLNGVASLVLVI